MINNNPLPVAEKVAIECNIMNAMRPPSVSETNGECKINGIHFDSILKHHVNDVKPWQYLENDKSIGFEYKEMQWSNGTSINSEINNSVGIIDTESSPVSFTYPDALGTGIDIKILQDNYKWQKIVEIKSLDSLKNIPEDAKYLEISFTLFSDCVLPEGIIDKRIPFGENSFIQPVKAWDSLQNNLGSDTFGEIKGNVLIKKIPVVWLKSAVYPVRVDTTITYGAENVFNSAITNYVATAALDSTHFVVAYRDEGNLNFGTAIIGEMSGTTISSYGAEHVFNSAMTNVISVAALDATHFVIAYQDEGNSFFGTAIVGEVLGTTISLYGAEHIFNSAITDFISVAALDSTHFVAVYQDEGNSSFGTAIIGEVSGTTINSYGAENVFNYTTTNYIAVAALDSTHFVVAYYNGANEGSAIVGIVSETTISYYGAENVFNSGIVSYISIAALDNTHFVIAYLDITVGYLGTAIIGEVSGTTISSYGTKNVFNSASTDYTSITALDSTHFVVAYQDEGNSNFGTTIVGKVSGTTISSYGTENVFNSTTTNVISTTSLDSTHFVVAYQDAGNSNFGTAIVGGAEFVNPMWHYGINTGEFNQLEFNVTAVDTAPLTIKPMWYYDMLRRKNQ